MGLAKIAFESLAWIPGWAKRFDLPLLSFGSSSRPRSPLCHDCGVYVISGQ